MVDTKGHEIHCHHEGNMISCLRTRIFPTAGPNERVVGMADVPSGLESRTDDGSSIEEGDKAPRDRLISHVTRGTHHVGHVD